MIRRDDQTSTNARPAKPDRPGAPSGGVVHSRRRLAGAGLSASVLMTLSSRSALASHCTVSGMMSGNLSNPHQGVVCSGGTPGYWKNHPEAWPKYVPGPCNPLSDAGSGNCNDYSIPSSSALDNAVSKGKITQAERDAYESELLTSPGTRFSTVFPGLPTNPGTLTLMQALWKDPANPYDPPSLVAHIVAALMNAIYWGEDAFGYSETGIIAYVNAGIGNPDTLVANLTLLNERFHPF